MSALVPLTITHASGTRVLELYQVASRTRRFAVQFEVVKVTPQEYRAIGDRLENPSALSVSVYVEEATFADSYRLAYEIIGECETATLVSYHEGSQLVNGILNASIRVDGLGLRIGLDFAPSSSKFEVTV